MDYFLQVDAINKHGQGLLQSAASGVSTSLLEDDLETLNDKWSNLNERVSNEYSFLLRWYGFLLKGILIYFFALI